MTNVKVVVGSNFGDEGKGLMTDYFCHQATSRNENCIVVMSNGGAQRGHTVTTPDGHRHVFHHFGSGTFAHADTYCCDKYILNPMTFREEYEELKSMGCTPKVFAHHNCMWSTPYDMMLNQIIEFSRGNNRHGSCGMGIWETIVRYGCTKEAHTMSAFNAFSDKEKVLYLKAIRDVYARMRLNALGVVMTSEWQDIFYSDVLINNFIDDIKFMCEHVHWVDDSVLTLYNNVVFENGQGLLLDKDNVEYGDNTTPSSTGIKNPHDIIAKTLPNANVEVCYVSRTYLTRHGAGKFNEECDKDIINTSMIDYTNVPNPFQGTIRYGLLDIKSLRQRVFDDVSSINANYKVSLAFTHVNEFDTPSMDNIDLSFISRMYFSDNLTRKSIR